MLEKEIESYFVKQVKRMGGHAYKFVSPSNRGVADRVVCLPDGTTHFVELKRPGGKISPLQLAFACQMNALNQNYACIWSKDGIDAWVKENTNAE